MIVIGVVVLLFLFDNVVLVHVWVIYIYQLHIVDSIHLSLSLSFVQFFDHEKRNNDGDGENEDGDKCFVATMRRLWC